MITRKKIESEKKVICIDGFTIPHLIRPVKISQGYNGTYSHFAVKVSLEYCERTFEQVYDNRFAIDFEVPFGTNVIAALDGVVLNTSLSNEFYEETDFEKGTLIHPSLIVISHGDFYSLYSHLGEIYNGISLNLRVKQGQPIATTGKTGWVGPIPHLHFEVFKADGPGIQSFPVKFKDYLGPLRHEEL